MKQIILFLLLGSLTFAQGGYYAKATVSSGSYVTGNLRLQWLEDSLETGLVANIGEAGSWWDTVDSTSLGAGESFAATKDADSGVVYYTGDYLRGASQMDSTILAGTGISIELVANLVDITADQFIVGLRYYTASLDEHRTFYVGIDGATDSLYAYYYNTYGTDVDIHTATSAVDIKDEYVHIVATTNKSDEINLYVNGVGRSDSEDIPVFLYEQNRIYVGFFTGSGSAVRYVRVYDDVLTSGEADQNFDWATSEGYLVND